MRLIEIEDVSWAKTYLSMVKRNCSEILNAIQAAKTLLYRGIRSGPENKLRNATQLGPGAWLGNSPINRPPRSSTEEEQEIIDGWLKKNNFVALRSNSIFASTHRSAIAFYGKTWTIFPIDGFNFTWFRSTDDLYQFVGVEISLGIPTVAENPSMMITSEREKFRHTWFEKNVDSVMKSANPDSKNLTKALGSGHEIMITGEYYAFARQWEKEIEQTLLGS